MKTNRWLMVAFLGIAAGGAVVGVREADAGSNAPDMFQQSYDSEAAGKVAEALAAIDGLPPSDRDTYVADLRRGWLLQRLGRNADAIAAYQKAIAIAPKAIEPRLGAMVPLMATRRWADVESAARDVLQRDPGNYLATIRLAFACYSLGRYPEAVSLYGKLKELYPSDVDVGAGLGWALLKMGKAGEAAREFRAVLAIAPKNALARDGLRAAGVP